MGIYETYIFKPDATAAKEAENQHRTRPMTWENETAENAERPKPKAAQKTKPQPRIPDKAHFI